MFSSSSSSINRRMVFQREILDQRKGNYDNVANFNTECFPKTYYTKIFAI